MKVKFLHAIVAKLFTLTIVKWLGRDIFSMKSLLRPWRLFLLFLKRKKDNYFIVMWRSVNRWVVAVVGDVVV